MLNVKKILGYMEKHNAHPRFYLDSVDYPEKKCVISADWNAFPDKKLWNILNDAGIFCPYNDEIYICKKCKCAVLIQPNLSYWNPAYIHVEDGVVCENCITKDNLSFYINNSKMAWPGKYKNILESAGFSRMDKKYHFRMENLKLEDPEKILKSLPKGKNYIFVVTRCDIFDTIYEIWRR